MALSQLLEQLQLGSFQGELHMRGHDPLVRSPHRLGEATATALLAEAAAAAVVWQGRGGTPVEVEVDVVDALHALHSTHYVSQSGFPISVGAEFIPTNGIFACQDGNFLMIESGPPYLKLERGYLNFFDCGNNRESLARHIAQRNSLELEEELSALGLPACLARTREQWLAHPQGQILSATPVIEIEKLADGPPMPLPPGRPYPLSDVKVLDFTHVLAGPHSTRNLAEYGAQVLHISSPYHRDTLAQNVLVNVGKRSAFLLLTQPQGRQTLQDLLRECDVFAYSYRPEVARRFELEPQQLVRDHPGMVVLSINAYGHSGPWKDRPGFDQNGQVATGFAWAEANQGVPRFSPVFYLNDLLTAHLASAGMMSALARRAREGGSYHVRVSLARSAMWVQELGLLPPEAYSQSPEKDEYPARLRTFSSVYGPITELEPSIRSPQLPCTGTQLLSPFGADPALWL